MTENVAIPQTHIDMLKENPDGFQLGFDQLYGAGAASRVLNTGVPSMDDSSQPGALQTESKKERSFFGKVWNNSVGAVVYGAQEASNELVDTLGDFDDWYAAKTEELGLDAYLEFGYTEEEGVVLRWAKRNAERNWFFGGEGEEDNIQADIVDAPTALPGQLVAGVSQFATGFIGAGRVFKMGGFLGAMGKGAIADALVFDPKDQNVTKLITDLTGTEESVIAELMATDVDDPNWQNRLRNVAEGAVLGMVIEGAFYALRARKLAKAGRAEEAEAATEAAIRASRKVERELAKELNSVKAQVDQEVPEITNELRKAMEEEQARRVTANTREDLPRPERDPNQLELPGISARDEAVPDMGVRRLTPEEIERIRYERKLADAAGPSAALRDTAIFRPGAQADWSEWASVIGSRREILKDEWYNKAPGNQAQTDAYVQTRAAVNLKEMSQLAGESPAALIARFRQLPGNPEDLPAEIVARGEMVKALSDVSDDLAEGIEKAVKEGFDKQKWPKYQSLEHMKADLAHKMTLLGEIIPNYNANRSTMGRTLRALQLAVGNRAKFEKMMSDPMNARNLDMVAKLWREARKTGKPPLTAVGKVLEQFSKIMDEVNTWRINFLLSGPGTHEVNLISNMIQFLKLPVEQLAGAALKADAAMARHAVMTLKGQLFAGVDALAAALDAFKRGEAELDAFNSKVDTDFDMKSLNDRGAIGRVVTLPMRFLLASDEFFKQSVFRGRILADADAIARQRGLKGKQRDQFIHGYIADSFNADGSAALKRNNALLQAQKATFTDELIPGSMAAVIQKAAQKNWFVRMIVPFVRTPTNILVNAVQHIPGIGQLAKTYQADIAAGGARAAQARGKQALGTAFFLTASLMAANGAMTGSGPKNPAARAIWLKNNRPYSFKWTNSDGEEQWMSYQRYEPIANIFAIIADFNEIMMDEYNEFNEDETGAMVGAIILAAGENSVNKTFLQGINDAMKLVTSRNEWERQTAISNFIGSFAPNLLNQTDGDQFYRVPRGMFDTFLSRAGVKVLDPRRNLLGEPIVRPTEKYDPLNLLTSDVPGVDPVFKELQNLARVNQRALMQIQSTVMAPKEPGGVLDLRDVEYKEGQSLYDGLLEHLSTVEINGKTLRQALEAEIKKPSYQKLYEGGPGMDGDGTRIGRIKDIIGAYREKAKGTFKPYIERVIEGKKQKGEVLKEHFSGTKLDDTANVFEKLGKPLRVGGAPSLFD